MVVVRAIIGGNGFGNEFLYLAKAITVSLDLGLDIWLPHWTGDYGDMPRSLNEKSIVFYRLKYIKYRLACYKHLVFDYNLYEQTKEVSISKAVLAYLKSESLGLQSKLVLSFPDLAVGIPSVAHRLSYLRALLMGNRNLAVEINKNFDKMCQRPLRIGFHIRRGDFVPELPLGEIWGENVWNTRIPFEWYENIAQLFQESYGEKVSYFLATNGEQDEVLSFIERYHPVVGQRSKSRGCHDIADLLTLSLCDVIITSCSWFSHWAVAFSNGLFLHYAPSPLPAIKKPQGIDDPSRISILMPDELPEKLVLFCDGRMKRNI